MKTIVLIVDDNKDILFAVKESLESNPSYSVECAGSGKECLEKMKSCKPDIILMDIMMPEMDGFEVVAKIKSDEQTKDIPVVFLTAKTDKLSKGIGKAMSVDYIEKPFDPADLKGRIEKIIKRRHMYENSGPGG
ncbi:MAG: response regulator [Candidatus Altiarchaeia archaeon]|jgi:CheY-like chemotaxis protein